MSDMLNRLYLPDGANLNVMGWGQAGSGKTVFFQTTLDKFLKKNKNEKLRVVVIAPKSEDWDLGKKRTQIVYNLESLERSIAENRMTVLYPSIDGLEDTVDEAINMTFDYQQANPESSFIVIIDDAQIFLSSRRAASDALKRLALTGRSRRIKGVFIAHNVVFSRDLEGQVDLLVGFSSPNPIQDRASIERFNFDPEPFREPLRIRPFSFVWFDTRDGEPRLMAPIEYTP
jgi:Cdc6-like AAA superfamily ATPase